MFFEVTEIDKAAQSCNNWDEVWIMSLFEEEKTAEIYGQLPWRHIYMGFCFQKQSV